MASKGSVDALKHQTEELRKQLVAFWDQTIDEEGNFSHTFGNPTETACSITVWVGYDEEGETVVEFVYPVDASAGLDLGEGLSDYDLENLEHLIIENSNLLDTCLYDFAHTITNFLQAIEDHPSLRDDKRIAWQDSKVKLDKEAGRYKLLNNKVTREAEEAAEAERVHKKREKERQAMEAAKAAALRSLVMRKNRRTQALRYQELEKMQEQYSPEELKERYEHAVQIESFQNQIRGLLPDYRALVKASDPYNASFYTYLEEVAISDSQYILQANKSISVILNYMQLLTNVTEVNLSTNQLESLPSRFFSMPNLQRLYLPSNQLKSLPPIDKATGLQVLDLHRNHLTELPEGIEALTNLRTLDLEHNKLRSIPGVAFGCLTRLDYLNLGSNLIRIVPPEIGYLEKLEHMQLKHNPVTNLPPHVYLQGNAATRAFLRKVSTVDIHPSALIADLTRLMPSFAVDRGHLAAHPPNFLCNLLLRATNSPLIQNLDNIPVVIPHDVDNDFSEHAVHDYLLAVRVPYLADRLKVVTTTPNKLTIDEKTQLPVLELPVTPKQLAVLVKYIYTDSYEVPQQIMLEIPDYLPQEAKDIIADHNDKLKKARIDIIAHAKEVSTLFKIPYLSKLVLNCYASYRTPGESTLLADMKRLYNNRAQSSDISFKLPATHPIHAHKALLCARSPYFNMLLTGGLAESQTQFIKLEEDPAIFEQIIAFCYIDDVTELDPETIVTLMATANRYNLDRLVQIVANVIGYSLDVENVSGLLASAKHYSVKPLAHACYFYILSHWSAVRATEGWKELGHDLRVKIIARATEWGIDVKT